MKTLILLLAAAACTVSAGTRQLLVDQDKASSWQGMVKYVPESARGKGPCFMLYGKYPTVLKYSKCFPVSPDKTYVYKASFRTLDEKYPASAYLGLELMDKNKRVLGFCNVRNYPKSESQVVSAKKGDRFLIVKKFPSFKTIKVAVVVFGAKDDFSDIPNFNISPQIASIKTEGNENLRINLKAPLKKDYPAGMAIRLHSPWTPSMYYLASGWMPAGKGKDVVVTLKGIMDMPGTPSDKFWKGTVYVRPFVWFGNWNRRPKAEARLLVDGFSFEEIDAPKK